MGYSHLCRQPFPSFQPPIQCIDVPRDSPKTLTVFVIFLLGEEGQEVGPGGETASFKFVLGNSFPPPSHSRNRGGAANLACLGMLKMCGMFARGTVLTCMYVHTCLCAHMHACSKHRVASLHHSGFRGALALPELWVHEAVVD